MTMTLDRAYSGMVGVVRGLFRGRALRQGAEDQMPGYARRRDATHADVRDCLRECGYTVFDAGSVGGSFPDLVVGAHGRTFLIEVKSPGGKPSEGQARFARDWRGGPVLIVYSAEEAMAGILKHVRGIA